MRCPENIKIHRKETAGKEQTRRINRGAKETLRERLSGKIGLFIHSKGNWEGGNQRVMRHS